jgi:ParB-like chromosome segregation protein Spo0J
MRTIWRGREGSKGDMSSGPPPLKPLHVDDSLSRAKLDQYDKATTQQLIDSLRTGQAGALKVRPDGTMVDGHHRVKILRGRGVDVDALPREIVAKVDP